MKPSKFLKPCLKCGAEFWAIPSKVAVGKDKYCSANCYRMTLLGKRLSPATEFTSARTKAEKNARWKGSAVSYGGLHDWIYLQLGRPERCEKCGATNRALHWANKSRTYKRDLGDWEQLCVPCHKKKDLEAIKNENRQGHQGLASEVVGTA
jgi:hypothetical protein